MRFVSITKIVCAFINECTFYASFLLGVQLFWELHGRATHEDVPVRDNPGHGSRWRWFISMRSMAGTIALLFGINSLYIHAVIENKHV